MQSAGECSGVSQSGAGAVRSQAMARAAWGAWGVAEQGWDPRSGGHRVLWDRDRRVRCSRGAGAQTTWGCLGAAQGAGCLS